MYPLLLMLILHTCAALPPLFEGPFIRSPSLFPSAFDGWPSVNVLRDFDTDWFMPFPATGPRPTKPPSTAGSGTTESAVCRAVADVSDLKFPPHSEIPTEGLKPEEILKNEVKQTTYLCKDKDDNEFYMLRTHAVFATNNIHNEQSTANYYSKKDNKPLIIGKDLNLDQTKLWEMVDSQEQQQQQEQEQEDQRSSSAFPSPFAFHPYWSGYRKWWHPYTSYEAVKHECDKHDELNSVEYPKIEVEDSVLGDKVVNKDVKHETFLCTDPSTKKKYFLLKTSVDVTTKSGSTFSRVQSISQPADSDGNPITDGDSSNHPKILSNTLSAVSQSFSTSSSQSKYNK